jgi:hypothetical protein
VGGAVATSSVVFSSWPLSVGQENTATVTLKNSSGATLKFGAAVVAVSEKTKEYIPFVPTTDCGMVAAGGSCTITGKATLPVGGNYYFYIYANSNGVPFIIQPQTTQIASGWFVADYPNIRATSSVNFSAWPLQLGQTSTASVTLRNNTAATVSLGSVLLARHERTGAVIPFTPTNSDCISLAAGASCTLTGTATLNQPGNYYFYIYGNSGGLPFIIPAQTNQWASGWFVADYPNIRATSSVFFSAWPLRVGQSNTAEVILRNNSAQTLNLSSIILARHQTSGAVIGFTPSTDCTSIVAGGSCTLTGTGTPPAPGNYYFYIYGNSGGIPFIIPAQTNQWANGWFVGA